MLYDYQENILKTANERYKLKLQASFLDQCPYKYPAEQWTNDPTKWPNLQWPDVYAYLIDTPGVFSRESIKNYKSLEAHNVFVSGWVQTVFHIQMDGTRTILLKADVRPSHRVNDSPHHPWVTCCKDGTVLSGQCDCMARLGESCSHVAALVFKVEAAVRMGYTSLARTDQLCLWNQCFVKKVQPNTIADTVFYKEASKSRLKNIISPLPDPATPQEQEKFLKSLAQCSVSLIILSSFTDFCTPFTTERAAPSPVCLPADLRTMHRHSTSDPQKRSQLCSKIPEDITVTPEQVEYVEEHTRKQASSVVWQQMRVGRITASSAHSFLHTHQERPTPSPIKKYTFPHLAHFLYLLYVGVWKMSQMLFYFFSQAYGEVHEGVKMSNVGLKLSVDQPFLGASTYSMVSCECCGDCIVEVKCPYKFKDHDQLQMYDDPNCCLTSSNILNTNHKYYMQMQMHVFKVPLAQFILWTPTFCIITAVQRNDCFIEEMVDRLTLMWKSHILPELITRSLETSGNSSASSSTTPATVSHYCYCKITKEVKMIGCDDPNRNYPWFHFSCLKRKTVPKGTWYCRECKKKST